MRRAGAIARWAIVFGFTFGLVACLRLVDFEPPCEEQYDLQSDPANCGACGVVCQSGVCANGVCTCPNGGVRCNGQCTRLDLDPNNCGGCGHQCAPLEKCGSGGCSCALSVCDGQCTNTYDNDAHCGLCGHSCPPGEHCTGGKCYVRCDGTAKPCEQRSTANCENGQGCVQKEVCTGKEVACAAFSGDCTLCGSLAGCSCTDGCSGSGCNCVGQTFCKELPKNRCGSSLGCKWILCSGETLPCKLQTEEDCIQVPGCYLRDPTP